MAASSATADTVGEQSILSSTSTVGEITQNGPRNWEKPWSIQQIHAEAGNWNLAGDAGLLQHLQEFSQRIISRTHQIGKDVDDLVHEAKLMDVRVSNVINDFIMLANTQFVENRVYDEDVTQEAISKEEKKVELEKTKEQREAELIPRVAMALKLGVDVIDSLFEKLDPRVVDSDSEEEDNSYVSEPILEAKDPYVSRPLPFLIGTPQFMEDDNVGLVDESSEEEEESDEGSISVSEEDKDGDESDSEYSASEESDEEERRKIAHRKHRAQTKSSGMSASSEAEADSGEDIFSPKKLDSKRQAGDDSGDVSDSEEEDDDTDDKKATSAGVPRDLSAELAARLGIPATKQDVDREDSDGNHEQWTERSSGYGRPGLQTSGINQQAGGQGHKNIDTSEKKTDRGEEKHRHSKKTVSDGDLFTHDNGQEGDDIFGRDKGIFSSSKGLFDDDDEDDEDVDKDGVFADVNKPSPRVLKSNEKGDSLFSDETAKGDDVPSSVSKLESSGTHVIKKPTAQPAIAPVKSTAGRTATAKPAAAGLFEDDEDDDDLFSTTSKKGQNRKENATTSSRKTTAKKSDLFADEDEDDDLFGSMTAAASTKKAHGHVGITVESYNEGEKVREKKLEDEQLRKQATPEKKLPPGAVSMFGKSPNPLLAALRNQPQTASSEEEENDWSEEGRNSLTSSIHSTSSTTLPPAALKSAEGTRNMDSSSSRTSSIFTDDRGDDDLFTIKPKSDKKSAADSQVIGKLPELDQKTPSKVKPVKGSLFDSSGDEDEEDVDLFSSAAKPPVSKTPGKEASLLGNSQTVSAAKTHQEPASRRVSQPAHEQIGSSLFDDQEEVRADLLFSGKVSSTAGTAAAPASKDTSKNKTQGLFAQDDLLFNSATDDDPFVDLFSSKSALTESTAKKETQKHTLPQTAMPAPQPAGASLFDGGDDGDDDDLFSVRPLTMPAAPLATTAPVMKVISGVTETESTDTLEVKVNDKPETKEVRKPAGSVSMFGGIDPSSVLKEKPVPPSNEDGAGRDVKRNDKEVKKDEKKHREIEKMTPKTPVLKTKPATDLFGGGSGGDDDDDDLFSPKRRVKKIEKGQNVIEDFTDAPAKEVTSASNAEPLKSRKPAGAVPLFGGLDTSGFLKNDKIAEVQAEKNVEGHEKEKPSPPQPAPKPKMASRDKQDESLRIKSQNGTPTAASTATVSSSLFGDDGEDSDDLFGGAKQKSTPPKVAPKSRSSSSSSSSAHHSSLAAPVDSPKSERKVPDVVRPKVLAGAVSMFGGIDPFAGMKKRSLSSEKDEETHSQKEKPLAFVDPLAVLTAPVTVAPAPKQPTSPGVLPRKSVDITAAINSSYVLPDETRSDQDTDLEKSGSVDFNEPADAETLASANKDRPKLNRRRPQSRKARVLAAAQTGIHFDNEPSNIASPTSAALKVPDVQDKPNLDTSESSNGAIPEPLHVTHHDDSKKLTSKPKSTDLFGNDNMLDGLIGEQSPNVPVGKTASDEIFSKGLFHGNSKISNGASEDLFLGFGKQTDIPPARSESTAAGKVPASKTEEFDDLFTKASEKTKTDDLSAFLDSNGDMHQAPSLTVKPKAKGVPKLDDDDVDDLFAPATKRSLTNSKVFTNKLDEDDLFSAPKSLPASSSSTSRAGSVADSKSADIFGEINDVFGASSSGRQKDTISNNHEKEGATGTRTMKDAKNVRPNQTVTKEAKLLTDDTDIFSDLPKSTASKLKKKTVKKAAEKTVFNDDIDDIFANTTAATIKPKKNIQKKVTKPASSVISDNIFDDPLT